MLGTLLLTHAVAIALAQDAPHADPATTAPPDPPRHPALDNPNFQRGKVVEFPNGLTGRIGSSCVSPPLSTLLTPETWIDVARATTALDLDPAGAAAGSLRSAAEAFRAALRERRTRDWRPAADRINASIAENEAHQVVDDERLRAATAVFYRDCALESMRNFDEESAALVRALASASGGELDPQVAQRASRSLWRTRVTEFLGDWSSIPMPPVVSILLRTEIAGAQVKAGHKDAVEAILQQFEPLWDASLRDLLNAHARAFTKTEDTPSVLRPVSAIVDRMTDADARAIAELAPHLDDPELRWTHAVLVRRCPHARAVADAWLGISHLAATAADPAIRTRLVAASELLRSQVDAMALVYRDGWRGIIIHGATPTHPEVANYGPEMRKIARDAQRQALALIATIDGAASEAGPADAMMVARATRDALVPVTGKLEDGKLAAKAIAPGWPPMVWTNDAGAMVPR